MGELNSSARDSRDGKWWARIVGILANVTALFITIIPYFIHLNYKFDGVRFCAATGFDHRLGWLATSALLPLFATLAIHMLNREWTLLPHTNRNIRVSPWVARLAVDVMAAVIALEFLIMLTGRVTIITILFGRLLHGKSQFFLAGVSTVVLLLTSVWQPLALLYSNPNRWLHKSLHWSLLGTAVAYALLVFLLQVFLDMEEYADLALDFVLPWNYRWQISNPSWSEWWGL